jgi:hypothetical protein
MTIDFPQFLPIFRATTCSISSILILQPGLVGKDLFVGLDRPSVQAGVHRLGYLSGLFLHDLSMRDVWCQRRAENSVVGQLGTD